MDEREKALAGQVYRKCHVSWEDNITYKRIELDIIPTAKAYLTERLALPEDHDFGKPGTVNVPGLLLLPVQ